MSRNKNNNNKSNRRQKSYTNDGKRISNNRYGNKEVVDPANKGVTRKSDVVNDASYYTDNDATELTTQLYTYSINTFAGVPFPLGYALKTGSTVPTLNSAQFGNIMQILLNPSVPFTDTANPLADGLNLASLRTYTFLSANNAKTTQYGPQDLSLLILAIGNILSNFSYVARALGMVFLYNQRNRAYPEAVIMAAGISPSNLASQYAEWLATYNYLIARFNKIPIPKNIKYFEKMSELYHGLYCDEEGSSMAQTYVFTPYSYWVYDEAYSSAGGGLRTVQFANSTSTADMLHRPIADVLTAIETQINALLSSSLFNYVYADVLRVHDKQSVELLQLNELPSGYTVLPAKVEEISLWINNAVPLGAPTGTSSDTNYTVSNDIHADANTNAVIYMPKWSDTYNIRVTQFDRLLNFKHDNPTLEEKIYAIRLHPSVWYDIDSSGRTSTYFAQHVALSDLYVVQIRICSSQTEGLGVGYLTDFLISSWSGTQQRYVSAFSHFDWAPYLYFWDFSQNHQLVSVTGDVQYWTNLPVYTLRRMFDASFFNEIKLRV